MYKVATLESVVVSNFKYPVPGSESTAYSNDVLVGIEVTIVV